MDLQPELDAARSALGEGGPTSLALEDVPAQIEELSRAMREAAKGLNFEKAAELRDRIRELSRADLVLRDPGVSSPRAAAQTGRRGSGRKASAARGKRF